MIVAPFLKLRDKLTRKRQALTQDEEKPFLEHLEDLRKTLTKVIITLTVAVVGCFVFYPTFFKILMHPLESAGLLEPKELHLPAAIKEMAEKEQQAAWWKIHGRSAGDARSPPARAKCWRCSRRASRTSSSAASFDSPRAR